MLSDVKGLITLITFVKTAVKQGDIFNSDQPTKTGKVNSLSLLLNFKSNLHGEKIHNRVSNQFKQEFTVFLQFHLH